MVFTIPQGRLLRLAYGPTDSEKRDWQFRNSRLHEQLNDRVEGFGSTLDYDRYGNMPSASRMRPGAPLANTDLAQIQIKNRYNAKAYPWLEAYDPQQEEWQVFRAPPPEPQQAQGTFARYKDELKMPEPSDRPCPCAVAPQEPAIPQMHLAEQPCPTQVYGQAATCRPATQLWEQQQRQPQPPSRSHWAQFAPQPPPRMYTPFSGGRGGGGGGSMDGGGSDTCVTFIIPTWGLAIFGALAALLLAFAVYGVVKATVG